MKNMFLLVWCVLPHGRRRARITLGGTRLHSWGSPTQSRTGCFGSCSWARWLEDKVYRVLPISTERARAKFTRECVVKQFWTYFVGDQFDLDTVIQTKVEFSYAIAAMDRIGGWEEGKEQENWEGARLAAIMWIYAKAVICNGHRHVQNFRIDTLRSVA